MKQRPFRSLNLAMLRPTLSQRPEKPRRRRKKQYNVVTVVTKSGTEKLIALPRYIDTTARRNHIPQQHVPETDQEANLEADGILGTEHKLQEEEEETLYEG